MRRWELSVPLDPGRGQPLFLQLAGAIADDIRRGRLKPGEPLPGTRELAESLELNRNTVVAGYDELAAEGLVLTRVGGGTFVAEQMPRAMPPAALASEAPTFAVAPPLPRIPELKPLPPRICGSLSIMATPGVCSMALSMLVTFLFSTSEALITSTDAVSSCCFTSCLVPETTVTSNCLAVCSMVIFTTCVAPGLISMILVTFS